MGMRLLIAGGGTGGHLFPGIALAEAALARNEGHQVLFVGTRRGVEAEAVPRAGFPVEFIEVGALKGRGWLGWLRGLLRIPRALWQSRRIVRAFRPDVVIGVGGYASGPVLLCAWLMRLPAVVLEQNALPGLTNRILGRLVRRAYVSFPESQRHFPAGRAVLLGNPVRKALVASLKQAPAESNRRGLLVFGGSQGAAVFNRVVPDAVARMQKSLPDLRVRHQTGRSDFEAVAARYQELQLDAEVMPFIHDMAAAYREADLVICRAGATTVAELALCRKPSLLVPLPHAADNHQELNARSLADRGAAVMIRQADLTPETLTQAATELLADPERLRRMAEAAGQAARPSAADDILADVLRMVRPQGPASPGGTA